MSAMNFALRHFSFSRAFLSMLVFSAAFLMSNASLVLAQNGQSLSASDLQASSPRQVIETPLLKTQPDGALSQDFPDINLMVILLGVWMGDDYERRGGGSAEVLWQALFSDGRAVQVTDSQKSLGGDGVQEGLEAGDWLGLDLLPLFTTDEAPKNGSAAVSFRLWERDDGELAERVFRGVGQIGATVLAAYTGDPTVGVAASQVVDIAASFTNFSEDDQVISSSRGLPYVLQNHLLGRIFSFRDAEGTAAMFVTIPNANHGLDEFFIRPFSGEVVADVTLDVPNDGVLATFARYDGGGFVPLVNVTLINEGGEAKVLGNRNHYVVHNSEVERGNHTVRVMNPGGGKVRGYVIFTKYGDTLAAPRP